MPTLYEVMFRFAQWGSLTALAIFTFWRMRLRRENGPPVGVELVPMKRKQFSLSGMLIAVAVIAIFLGLELPRIRERQRQEHMKAHETAVEGYRSQRKMIEKLLRPTVSDQTMRQAIKPIDDAWRKDWKEEPPAFP
jgi:hypothetical protein